MTSIGGLAQYLNQTPANASSLFGSSSLFGGQSATPASLMPVVPSYAFPTDNRGRPVVATMADMAALAKPGDKLTIAGQVAEAIRMQTDCATHARRADRIIDMTGQTKALLDSVTQVVSGLATTDGSVPEGKADPAIKPYQSKLSTVLGRVASVMANIHALTSKATPAQASQTKATLATLNTEAGTLAAQAGLDWTALTKAATTPTAATAATKAPRLIDYLA